MPKVIEKPLVAVKPATTKTPDLSAISKRRAPTEDGEIKSLYAFGSNEVGWIEMGKLSKHQPATFEGRRIESRRDFPPRPAHLSTLQHCCIYILKLAYHPGFLRGY